MRKPKIRELGEAIRAVWHGPYTVAFPFGDAPEPPEGFRGKPTYDEKECVGCTACAEVCPAHAITVTDDTQSDPPTRRLELRYDECIFCGQCELNCTTEKGIKLSTECDLATLDRSECVESVEKDLVLCEVCGAVIGARDHLCWVAERTGAKSYANPTLFLVAQGEQGLVEAQARHGQQPPRRADMMRVTCPKCRRAVLVREMWG